MKNKRFLLIPIVIIGLVASTISFAINAFNNKSEYENTIELKPTDDITIKFGLLNTGNNVSYDWYTTAVPTSVTLEVGGATKEAIDSKIIGLDKVSIWVKEGTSIDFQYSNECKENAAKNGVICELKDKFNILSAFQKFNTSMTTFVEDALRNNFYKATNNDIFKGSVELELERIQVTDRFSNTSDFDMKLEKNNKFSFSVSHNGLQTVADNSTVSDPTVKDIVEKRYTFSQEFELDCKDRPDIHKSSDDWSMLSTSPAKAKGRTYPGLCTNDGKKINIPSAPIRTGARIDVTDFGASPENADNYQAFKDALATAKPGDEVYIPNGVYNFVSSEWVESHKSGDIDAHIIVPSGVIFRGQSRNGTILKTMVGDTYTRMATVYTKSANVRITSLTITSDIKDEELPNDWCINNQNDCTDSVYAKKAPMAGVLVSAKNSTHLNTFVEELNVERFYQFGIHVNESSFVTVRNNHVTKASALGGGAKGYGICISGTGASFGSEYNIVHNNYVEGPQIRHAIIQSRGANTLITQNTMYKVLTGIDLHGARESLTEMSHNRFINNRGTTHSINMGHTTGPTGLGNFAYKNYFENAGSFTINSCSYNQSIKKNVFVNTRQLIFYGSEDIKIEDNKFYGMLNNSSSALFAIKHGVNGPSKCDKDSSGKYLRSDLYSNDININDNYFENIRTILNVEAQKATMPGVHKYNFANNQYTNSGRP